MPLVGVGIDTLEVARVARLLDDYGDTFVGRWFTPAEAHWCRGAGSPASAFATVLSAKEAVWKALRPPGRRTRPVANPRGHPGRRRRTCHSAAGSGSPGVDVVVSVRAGTDLVVASALAWTTDPASE
jgi:phosphopantetheinyl transferase (holo-ACP synthase)